ncbi:hypothetical protein PBAL39_18659 [Pedobacter sp. BAL39]|uniref:DUF6266 family protein n=1 Tax=Pedobacter sp. BAL39 TaxID=391596 RepID=UPI000155971C|nr:DUF6266 family protein [Pedobacter sp. BAL39]EDM36924.1 hypothetical protein PBAL39_18659 [Pedobacter sp. BAL39]
MAIAGRDGRFIGKMRNVVYYMLRGQYVSRTIGKQPKRKTEKQLANQHAMSVTMDFVRAVNSFIKVSFALEAQGTTKNAHNLATSYVKKHALTGQYPNMRVDYSKVILSNGAVPVTPASSITKVKGGVTISWQTDDKIHWSNQNDMVMVLLYLPGKRMSIPMFNAAKRKDGQVYIPLRDSFANEPMEAFMCFKTADGTEISNSIYLGNLNGAALTAQDVKNQEKYEHDKAHFKTIEAKYLQVLEQAGGEFPDTKSFRVLQAEYMALQRKYGSSPGQQE